MDKIYVVYDQRLDLIHLINRPVFWLKLFKNDVLLGEL